MIMFQIECQIHFKISSRIISLLGDRERKFETMKCWWRWYCVGCGIKHEAIGGLGMGVGRANCGVLYPPKFLHLLLANRVTCNLFGKCSPDDSFRCALDSPRESQSRWISKQLQLVRSSSSILWQHSEQRFAFANTNQIYTN